MNLKKSIAAAALTLFVATAPAAFAKDKGKDKHKNKHKQKTEQSVRYDEGFRQFDTNGDGVISRAEFPADRQLFNRLDTNRDGVVSRSEGEAFARSDAARRLAEDYRAYDANRDGRISRAEWRGDLATFDRLDRNNDGFVSNSDRHTAPATTRFTGLDRNRDGVVTRSEWRGNDTSFRNQDRNRDGVLSGTELR